MKLRDCMEALKYSGPEQKVLWSDNCIIAHPTLYSEVQALFQSGRHVDAIGTLSLFVSRQRLTPGPSTATGISQVNGCCCTSQLAGGLPVLASLLNTRRRLTCSVYCPRRWHRVKRSWPRNTLIVELQSMKPRGHCGNSVLESRAYS